MASRGRRVPNSRLGSKLREVELAARKNKVGPSGATGAVGPTGPPGPVGATGATGAAGFGARGSTVATTNASGVASWSFPAPDGNTPHISATPLADGPAYCTITTLTTLSVSVTCWNIAGLPLSGAQVHLIAFA